MISSVLIGPQPVSQLTARLDIDSNHTNYLLIIFYNQPVSLQYSSLSVEQPIRFCASVA